MSICNCICETVKDYLLQAVVCVYNQPIVKDTIMSALIMYDNYCEKQETEETQEEEIDLDAMLAEFDEAELKLD